MMLIDFIAFIVSMLILIFLMGRRAREERKKMKDPKYRKEQERLRKQLVQDYYGEKIDDFDGELDLEGEQEESPPVLQKHTRALPQSPPYRFASPTYAKKSDSKIEDLHLQTRIDEQSVYEDKSIVSDDLLNAEIKAYQIREKPPGLSLRGELGELPSLQRILIYHEVFAKPKAFRQQETFEFPLSDT